MNGRAKSWGITHRFQQQAPVVAGLVTLDRPETSRAERKTPLARAVYPEGVRVLRALFILLAIVAFASVARASTDACPSDPGACFVDLDNDGCFDAESDTLGVETQMVAADFDTIDFGPGAGLVCPPSVKRLDIVGIDVTWRSRGDATFLRRGESGFPPTGASSSRAALASEQPGFRRTSPSPTPRSCSG